MHDSSENLDRMRENDSDVATVLRGVSRKSVLFKKKYGAVGDCGLKNIFPDELQLNNVRFEDELIIIYTYYTSRITRLRPGLKS